MLRLAWALVAMLVLPSASALELGVDAASVAELRAAGGDVAYGQTWVGAWMRTSGWDGYEGDLAMLRDAGVTPVVMWYYWGDAISPDCVTRGCDGLSVAQWTSMAGTLADKAHAVLGGAPFLVVLEPEFNKAGIGEDFDGLLAAQATLIKQRAPEAKLVVGFGSWGGYAVFDRAVAASDMTGFQLMRASTRDAPAESAAPSARVLATTQQLSATFGKPVLLFDLAIGSFGGWEEVQRDALDDLRAHDAALSEAGLVGVVWRYVHDNARSSGYFGAAETTWGLVTTSGETKPGWASLVAWASPEPATRTHVAGGWVPA